MAMSSSALCVAMWISASNPGHTLSGQLTLVLPALRLKDR
jgi:hypothetical protein